MVSRGLVSYELEEESEEKRSSKESKRTSKTTHVWQEYVDDKSGKPYYWNAQTLEVTWQRPKELLSKRHTKAVLGSRNRIKKKGGVGKKASSVVYGPSLPTATPEERIREKAKHFELNFAQELVHNIERLTPPDWAPTSLKSGNANLGVIANAQDMKPRRVHTKPFKWEKGSDCLSKWRTMVTKSEEKSEECAIALLAGVYGDDDDDEVEEEKKDKEDNSSKHKSETGGQIKDKEDEDSSKDRKNDDEVRQSGNKKTDIAKSGKTSSRIKVKATISKQTSTNNVKRTHRAFLEDEDSDKDGKKNDDDEKETDDDDDTKTASRLKDEKNTSSVQFDKRGRKIYECNQGPSLTKSIDAVAEMLANKLEALQGYQATAHQAIKVIAIKVETLSDAWSAGALSSSYMQRIMDSLASDLLGLEQSEVVSPKGYRAFWDSGSKRYRWECLESGNVFDEKPSHQPSQGNTEEREDEAICSSSPTSPPPLPPMPPPSTSPPPPPPPSSPPPPPPESQPMDIEDMELDEDTSSSKIEHFAPVSKDVLTDTLDEFYASLNDGNTDVAGPVISHGTDDVDCEGSSASNSPRPDDEQRDRKKRKTNAGGTKFVSSLKRRGVDGLVAKWQSVQQEVNRKQ